MTSLDAFTNGCHMVLFIVALLGSLIMWIGLIGDFSDDDGQYPQDASWMDKVPLQCKFIVTGAVIWIVAATAGSCL